MTETENLRKELDNLRKELHALEDVFETYMGKVDKLTDENKDISTE